MKRIVLLTTLVLVIAAIPACVFAQTTPPECQGLPPSQWMNVPYDSIGNWSGGGVVADPLASEGFADLIPESSQGWNTMYWTTASEAGSYHCFAHVRVDTNATSGNAFSLGIYDYTTASNIQQNIMLEGGASDGQYHGYDLGERLLKPNSGGPNTGTAFWFASANNPSVTAAYVDRIVLIAPTEPAECVGLPTSQWIDIQQEEIGNWSGGGAVADSAASDGFAQMIPESSVSRNTMYFTSQAGSYHCYAHMRVDTNATSGNAFSLGIWDYTTTSSLVQQNITLQNGASDGQYHVYDLGEWYLKPNSAGLGTGTAFWFASANNPSVTAAYVDRIVLVAPTVPAECVGLPSSQWIDIQQEEIGNWSGGGTVADSAASDGFARMIPESSVSWNTMYSTMASEAGLYHCYAHVRVATNATSGNAFSMGIWDYTVPGGLVQENIMLQNGASDGQYHVYDLGISRTEAQLLPVIE